MPLTTRQRLRKSGICDEAIATRLADGRMWEIWPPVLMVNVRPHEVLPDHVLGAAVLLVGLRGTLDGASALERRGLWDRHDGSITVSSDRGHAPITFLVPRAWRRSKPWSRRRRKISIRFVRSRDAKTCRVDVIGGIRTRSATDALVRAASGFTPHQLAYVIKRAEYTQEFSLEDVARLMERRGGRRGNRSLRRAVELRRAGSAGTKSRSEDVALVPLTKAFGEPLVNVRGSAGIPSHEPDFCWTEWKWIVEIDGGHHIDDPAQREADRRTDELLRSMGWTVVRIWWERVWNDLPGVMAEIRAAFHPARVATAASSR